MKRVWMKLIQTKVLDQCKVEVLDLSKQELKKFNTWNKLYPPNA